MSIEPFNTRRRALLERLGKGVAVFPSAPIAIRNGGVEHDYRQHSDFFYLTGLLEPDCLLLLSNVHPAHRSVLFVRPRDVEQEQWQGRRLGVDEAPDTCGVDAAFPIGELAQRLPDYLQNAQRVVVRLGEPGSVDGELFSGIAQTKTRWKTGIGWPTEFIDPLENLHEMRLRKEPSEVAAMRLAAAITSDAHIRAMREARPGMVEYELEAAISHTFRTRGSARHAYAPIVASGPNATVLHYTKNDRVMLDGDLVLIDAGCELNGSASDITRTFPVGGSFRVEQRQIYEIVLAAQTAAIDMVKPGICFDAIHKVVCQTLVDGLLELELLAGTRDEVMENQSFKRFFPHSTGHWLGMDVHDVGRYFVNNKSRPLEPGMVLTIEPGLYIPAGGDQAPDRYQGIGVRIEDDVLVTEDGHEVLTSVPKKIEDVEEACKG